MKLVVSFPPHRLYGHDLNSFHQAWIVAALPATLMGVYLYGLRSVLVLVMSILGALVGDVLSRKIMSKPVDLADRHTILAGLLLGLALSPAVPWWLALIAGVTAVVLGKQVYGGLGFFPFNPVLVAWAVVYMSWPDLMGHYIQPQPGVLWPSLEKALTPLAAIKADPAELMNLSFGQVFWGVCPGPIGATSAAALLLGGLWLFYKGYLKLGVPAGMILGFGVMAVIFNSVNPDVYPSVWMSLCLGTFMISAFLIGPDPTTTPVSPAGIFLFGLGAGLTAFFIRTFGTPPDGPFFGILVFNTVTPILDRIRPKPLGLNLDKAQEGSRG